MDSNLLVQASSKLSPLMMEAKPGIFKSSVVSQISAYIYYNSQVISSVMQNEAFKDKFNKTIYGQIEKDFGNYIDAKARISKKTLHHVYEWNRAGEKTARLFKLNKLNTNELSFKVLYDFLPSKSFAKSNKERRHVFTNKASVMEAGMPLKIAPRHSKRLVFETNGYTVFMPEGASVVVKNPGGSGVRNAFQMAYSHFFKGNLVNESIKRSGFQALFNSSISKALSLPPSIRTVKYYFSPNGLSTQARSAVAAAFGGIV